MMSLIERNNEEKMKGVVPDPPQNNKSNDMPLFFNSDNIYTSKNFTFFQDREIEFQQNLFRRSEDRKFPIHYVEAIHGGGKTYAMVQGVANSALNYGGIYVIMVGTNQLGTQIHEDILNVPGIDSQNVFYCLQDKSIENQSVHVVDSEEKSKTATELTLNALNVAKSKPYSILIISHKSYHTNPVVRYNLKKISCHVLMDEVPNQYHSVQPQIATELGRTIINTFFEVVGSIDDDAYLLQFKESARDLLDGAYKDDFIKNNLSDVLTIASRDGVVVCQKYQWNKVIGIPSNIPIEETVTTKKSRGEKNLLALTAVDSPKLYQGFRSFTIFSADVTRAPLFKQWERINDFKLIEATEFYSILRYKSVDETTIADRLYINCLAEDSLSKANRKKDIGNGVSFFTKIKDLAIDSISRCSKPCIVRNNDLKKDTKVDGHIKTYHPAAIELSSFAHGSNQYMDSDGIVFLSALNPNPHDVANLKSLGWTDKDIHFNFNSSLIQSVMRTSLRDPNSTKTVYASVVGINAVEAFRDYFGKDLTIDFSKMIKSDRETRMSRQEAYSRKRLKNLEEIFLQNPIKESMLKQFQTSQDAGIMNFSTMDTFYGALTGQFSATPTEFVKYLKAKCKHNSLKGETREKAKKSAPVMSPVLFDDFGRTNQLARFATSAMYDVDLSSLTMDEMLEIFKTEFGKNCFAYASISSDRSEILRYRIIIFFKYAVDVERLKEFHLYVENVLQEKYGLLPGKDQNIPGVKFSGLDRSKFSESSFFLLPAYMEGDAPVPHCQTFKTYEELEDNLLDAEKLLINSEFIKNHRLEVALKKEREELARIEAETKLKKIEDRKQKQLDRLNSMRKFAGTKPITIDQIEDNRPNKLFEKLMMRVKTELVPGSRSTPACSIAGAGQYLDYDKKTILFQAIVAAGIDKSTVKSVRKYMRI